MRLSKHSMRSSDPFDNVIEAFDEVKDLIGEVGNGAKLTNNGELKTMGCSPLCFSAARNPLTNKALAASRRLAVWYRSNLERYRSNLMRYRSNLERFRSVWSGIDPIWSGIDPIWSGIGPIWSGIGPIWSGIGPI
jgi:hypothetical protein